MRLGSVPNSTGTGGGGSDQPDVKAEFSATPYVAGTVGAARSDNPDTFNSQFFITFGDASFLNGQYTVFGKVVSGMDVVTKIAKTPTGSGGPFQRDVPRTPVVIEQASVVAAK